VKIVWKDIFKPRYALIVEIERIPCLPLDKEPYWEYSPVIRMLPFKRPLSVPFNMFYNQLGSMNTIHFCCSKRTLGKLYGIGSALPHNVKNAIIFKPKESKS